MVILTIYGQRHPGEKTSRIVLKVAHNLLDRGYCLYLDNWYTSPNLVVPEKHMLLEP